MLYGDVMGDVRCDQCLDGARGFEPFPQCDLIQLGAILASFGRDLECKCGAVRYDAASQTTTSTAGTDTNGT
jgi:hypothetical protein